ncbi:dynein heavy chain 5, axonemal, partial [Caerostris extrusa]
WTPPEVTGEEEAEVEMPKIYEPISRIIRSPGGHALLVGVGGSGKQSLTKLAAFIAHYNTQQISLTRNYSATNFLEDLKILYRTTGIQDKGTTFIFTDQALKDECGRKLRARSLKFPGIVSGCTVDWFQPWPKEALTSVSRHFLKDFDMQCDQVIKQEVILFHGRHAQLCCRAMQRILPKVPPPRPRDPKSFLSFLGGYRRLYEEKHREIGNTCRRMENGISKLEEASFLVEGMKETLAVMEEELEVASKTAEQVLAEVSVRADAAEVVRDSVERAKNAAQEIVKEIQADKAIAEENWRRRDPHSKTPKQLSTPSSPRT